MADAKITELDALGATPDNADLVAMVDDVAGTPVTKKLTIANLKGQNLFYAYKTSQQVLTGSYAAITGWAAAPYDDGAYTFNTTTGILTINTTGVYLVGYAVQFNLETGTRVHCFAQLEEDALGGASYAKVPGTGIAGYGRTVDQGSSGSITLPMALTATDLLRVTAYEASAGGEINSTTDNGTNFWAVLLV
jgi:hypothetical protein